MANGTRVPSMGTAQAEIKYQGYKWPITFEVLDSRGAFELLIGKDWLSANGAKQDFLTDTLSLCSAGQTIYIENSNPDYIPISTASTLVPPTSTEEHKPNIKREADDETQTVEPKPESTEEEANENKYQDGEQEGQQRRVSKRLLERKMRLERRERNPFWVSEQGVMMIERMTGMGMTCDSNDEDDKTLEESWGNAKQEVEEQRQREIMQIERASTTETTNQLKEALRRAKRAKARIRGPADVMALVLESSRPEHEPIPQPPPLESERTTDPFNAERVAEILGKVKLGEALSGEQRHCVKEVLREYADIFALNLSEVLPVSITELKLDVPPEASFPKKVGQKKLTEPQRKALYEMLDELERAQIVQRVTQDQVAAVSPISLVPKPGGTSAPSIKLLQQMANTECRKYGIQVKYPDVKPFPMGDLFAKQQAVAGHRYISVMDLHAGFHAIPIAPESVPYTGFHVDGRGYYVYLRMPFGLTSAPTTFCEMVAKAFHNLIGEDLEVWMDDMAMAADNFESGLVRLIRIFERCRARKISLSAGKTVLFMSEAKFAGAMVSIEGIKPDLSKVKSILEWPEPQTVLEVMSFIEPLTNLTRNVQRVDSKTSGRGGHRRALKDAKITLNVAKKKAFAELKIALTSNPVLKAPVYDGRPFIITTDGSKVGFGAVVSQAWEETDKQGKTHKVMYPIAFASKRTSRSEEKYPPFLLEFAALKFGCDEFDSLIYGQPIEIETDCKALADLLGNNKLNLTHERWRESITARNIVAVRHKPGTENVVCDRLSRMYEGREDKNAGPGRDRDVDPGWESIHDLVNDLYLLTSDTDTKELLNRYGDDDYFRDIVLHLLYEAGAEPKNEEEARDWKQRAHRAEGYLVENGKLWLIGGKHSRGHNPVECIPASEGLELAHAVHSAGGHFGRDLTILALQQEYHWPRMRRDTTEAVTSCPKC
ncbi:Retrovirus-related Pol polyprotein from transposon opus OS=Drosophila melanogaster GN=pol PE=4 SV=1 [Rhizoctonia solani AG-1 IB]|uniref:Retrovirus-related Pol polyprotein from transposon opus n=1 Tax=Thanatephorus cucumeris (strain AG1-IB / isolate 7/3/14) TaxID=1108050 RepID=A0A0B7F975_THACB|nr:Retrovirus-related Pol polyprotein from transposon opus OS=Drosophila melanogaster GN=pol PE=4 SV=1 [Rhizoctonia solani AG-1 IB]